jgi:hypothetical protein
VASLWRPRPTLQPSAVFVSVSVAFVIVAGASLSRAVILHCRSTAVMGKGALRLLAIATAPEMSGSTATVRPVTAQISNRAATPAPSWRMLPVMPPLA